MQIIIKHIPKILVLEELESHLRSLLRGGLLKRQGELKAVRMLHLIDKTNKTVEGHALAWVDSEASKQRLIKTINAGSFREAFLNIDDEVCNYDNIIAAEFAIRHHSNERRMLDARPENIGRERRRHLNLITFAEKTYGSQSLQTSARYSQASDETSKLKSWSWNPRLQRFS